MPGKLPSLFAFSLVIAAIVAMSRVNQGRDIVEVETRKIPVDRDSLRSTTANPQEAKPKPGAARVLFITAKGCSRCEQELNRLRKPGGDFETMRAAGWKIGESTTDHIQIVDRDQIPDLVRLLKVSEYPTVACVVDGEIVRSFKEGCTTPLDVWTFGWLLKGQSERPQSAIPEAIKVQTTGNYRLRGNHWSVEADPNPSKQTVINHLRGPNHGHASVAYGAIEGWSYEELRSLHDDLHEREGGTIGVFAAGPYQPPAANRSLDAFSGSRKAFGK